MIIRTVALMPMEVEENTSTYTKLLCAEHIQELEDAGYRRVTFADGYVHVQNEKEMEQDRDSGIMWNPKRGNVGCCFCLQSSSDSSTGLIVKCKTCKDAYHQNCHTPKLGDGDFEQYFWECAVCSGADKEICAICKKNWTDPLNNNRLVYCEGSCYIHR